MRSLVAISAILSVFLAIGLLGGCGNGTSATPAPDVAELRVYDSQTRALQNTEWVAFQDGDGGWQALAPSVTGVYRHAVTDAGRRYAFALVHVIGSGTGQQVDRRILCGTTGEIDPWYAAVWHDPAAGGYTISGTLRGGVAGQQYSIASGGSSANGIFTGATADFQLSNIPEGVIDLLATLSPVGDGMPSKMVLRRNQTLGSDLATDIDFASASAPATYTITLPGAAPYASVSFTTAHGCSGIMATAHNASTITYAAPPTAAGDYFTCYTEGNRYSSKQVFTTAGNKSFALNTTLPGPASISTADVLHPSVVWTAYPGASLYQVDADVLTATRDDAWTVLLTPGWLHGASAYTLPDFRALSGWDPAWALTDVTGVTAAATVGVITGNRPIGTLWTEAFTLGHYSDGASISTVYATCANGAGFARR